jgi:hypothetical protein
MWTNIAEVIKEKGQRKAPLKKSSQSGRYRAIGCEATNLQDRQRRPNPNSNPKPSPTQQKK